MKADSTPSLGNTLTRRRRAETCGDTPKSGGMCVCGRWSAEMPPLLKAGRGTSHYHAFKSKRWARSSRMRQIVPPVKRIVSAVCSKVVVQTGLLSMRRVSTMWRVSNHVHPKHTHTLTQTGTIRQNQHVFFLQSIYPFLSHQTPRCLKVCFWRSYQQP